jgi:hypothetical protein
MLTGRDAPQPDVRHGTILWPNDSHINIYAVHRAAEQEATASVGPDALREITPTSTERRSD